jgi:hypothetical protein
MFGSLDKSVSCELNKFPKSLLFLYNGPHYGALDLFDADCKIHISRWSRGFIAVSQISKLSIVRRSCCAAFQPVSEYLRFGVFGGLSEQNMDYLSQ